MSRPFPIAASLLLLLAITVLAFTSCNVSKKSGGGKRTRGSLTEQIEEPSTVSDTTRVLVPVEESPIGVQEQTTEPADGPTVAEEQPLVEDDPDPATVPAEPEEIPYEDIPFEDEPPAGGEGSPIPEDSTAIDPSVGPDSGATIGEAGESDPDPFMEIDMEETTAGTFIPEDDDDVSTAGTYRPEEDEEQSGGEMKVVDFEADIMRPINITEDSTALNLLGNVVFYHNGAVITCDSAVRYSEKRMDCFKRVIINNGTTYVYGDRAEYNGETNTARVFSPIVKMVDEDAVLYTYRFSFNTLTKVGRYSGGGVLTQEDNRMESQRGYYDTETRQFTGAGEVELLNPDYKLVSDSVRYNLDTEVAEFFTTTHIWNEKGEILIADRGSYRNSTSDYHFTRNSYILTDEQEIWADTLLHNSLDDYTELRRDIQIIDEENNSMAFGDYGEYWGETEQGMLTLDPALVSFDPEEPADTLYMRSDSMFFYTYPYEMDFFKPESTPTDEMPLEELIQTPAAAPGTPEGTVVAAGPVEFDEEGNPIFPETGVFPEGIIPPPGEGTVVIEPPEEPGEPFEEGDLEAATASGEVSGGELIEIAEELEENRNLSRRNRREESSRASRRAGRSEGAATENIPDGPLSEQREEESPSETIEETVPEHLPGENGFREIGETGEGPEGENENGLGEPEQEQETYVNPYTRLAEILQETITTDSAGMELTVTEFWLKVREEIETDSLRFEYYTAAVEEAIGADTLNIAIPAGTTEEIIGAIIAQSENEMQSLLSSAAGPAEPEDSLQRVFYGYRNVRIFREDFQAVCDSLVGFSKDSTLHLHIDPVMWSDQNQVTSDIMVIFTRDEQLYKAEFTGNPFMASEVDSTRYNQIKGKFMESWFRDNTIYRHDVFGNGQNFYYMEDDKTGEIDGFMTVECADITYFIEDNTIDEIIYRLDPVYWIYPIDMIPPDVDQFLPGFTWQIKRRPMSRYDVFDRTIRPRQRERVLALPQPEFPITATLEATKERLINQNLWRDRNDRLSPEAIEFMRYVQLRDADDELIILPREPQTQED